ncbi:NAD(P)-dependent oxidoreductase [Actinosynnema sp. NPDC047251]|uniref:2-hydroxy-3-oxopropionate reductase n=1 Tax=Saccharothrix espanaensis (strain ATCC 51144 / DSM 44229 / JCM 9112 / NBRC 15066 / NRRL 15764) TaxID=1179773 RepID=K0JTL0_SACES|nr:NAD(P)-dependent oxidoreductase [Saccharothrix espanaensis]CCH28882.1 2-hydroxy-3-oxopropionate reductase [Saccharothrix espanaensis DSM 44229]
MRQDPIAVLGLGAMGRPIARNLARAGFPVTAWNRTPGRDGEVRAAGAVSVRTPAEAALPVVLTVLPDLADVVEVLEGPTGLLAGWREVERPVLVVMGTHSPAAVRALGEELPDVRLVDAPVSGGDIGAEAGTLSIMVGGHADDVLRLQPYFSVLGTTVRHLGPLGSGQMTKACNQIVVGAVLNAVSEALALAVANGLDPETVLDVLGGGLAGGAALEAKREKWVSGDYTPGGRARHQLKDLAFALEAGRASNVPLPVTAAVGQMYTAMCALGLEDDDHSGIYQVYQSLTHNRRRP